MSELAKKLSEGQIPLPGMMTAGEIVEHFSLGDSPSLDDLAIATAGTSKSDRQKEADKAVLRHKLMEAGPLKKDIAKNGIKEPLKVNANLSNSYYNMRPEVRDGHHRLAVAHNLNPNQFVNFKYTS